MKKKDEVLIRHKWIELKELKQLCDKARENGMGIILLRDEESIREAVRRCKLANASDREIDEATKGVYFVDWN